MIRFADKKTTSVVKDMWQVCFGDTDAFMELLFRRQFKEENTLIYFNGDEAVASLQMLPYTISFYGKIIPFAYMAGLCTLPGHRRKGYMELLIHEAHGILAKKNIPLAILVPAEEWLFDFYTKYGYEQVFDNSQEPIYSLTEILKSSFNIEDAYIIFDEIFNKKDFCIQKSFYDFETIIEEYKMDHCPDKYNLAGMARIIDAGYLYSLCKGKNTQADIDLDSIDIRLLCRLLFGYKTSKLGTPLSEMFPEHHPVMNLMLE